MMRLVLQRNHFVNRNCHNGKCIRYLMTTRIRMLQPCKKEVTVCQVQVLMKKLRLLGQYKTNQNLKPSRLNKEAVGPGYHEDLWHILEMPVPSKYPNYWSNLRMTFVPFGCGNQVAMVL